VNSFPGPARIAATLPGLIALIGAAAMSAHLVYPATRVDSVTDSYYGTSVVDPYRWLENPNDPAVKTWAQAQTKLAVDYVEERPEYAAFLKRIVELDVSHDYRFDFQARSGHLFFDTYTSPDAQAKFVVADSLRGAERVLFDPNRATLNGALPQIEAREISADGKIVALATQFGGDEDSTIHVVDVATGAMLADALPHAGGGTSPVAVLWDADDKGFLHTRWPQNADGSYATTGIRVYHHVLGTDPKTDTYVFGNGLSPKSEFRLASSVDGTVQAAFVTAGDGVHASVYLRRGQGSFSLVATPEDAIGGSEIVGSGSSDGVFVGNTLYAITRKRSPLGEIVALVPGETIEKAKVIVPASSVLIGNVVPVAGGFVTVDVDGGDDRARLFNVDGTLRYRLPIPDVAAVSIVADPGAGPIDVIYSTPIADAKFLEYDAGTNSLHDTGFSNIDPADYSHLELKRVLVPSLDGKAQIPLEIEYARNVKRDGTAPTIMTAYGAYGTVYPPYFDYLGLAWLERGGVLATARVRGGGDYGEAWHTAARLSTKTVSSDDLAACATWLGQHGYGDKNHLGIYGGSAGGFLMGLAMTRNPGLYRAVMSSVGFYDLLRFELTPNGAYNTGEFGTVKDATQFSWMLAQSPYHNVRKGTAYPAVLMKTGENDPRVDPYNSRKMIAALQASTSSNKPALLIERSGEGHHGGDAAQDSERALAQEYAFFDSQLR
jgi:prolyl oligopeptidase